MRPEEKKELDELKEKKLENYKKMVHEKLKIHRNKKANNEGK